MPDNIPTEKIKLLTKTRQDFERENKILHINNRLKSKYNFLPESLFETFIIEVNRLLRNCLDINIKDFEEAFCQRIKSSKEPIAKTIYIDRKFLTEFNQFAYLSIEQTLADAIYKATGEAKVYALTLEELLETLETINTIKNIEMKK